MRAWAGGRDELTRLLYMTQQSSRPPHILLHVYKRLCATVVFTIIIPENTDVLSTSSCIIRARYVPSGVRPGGKAGGKRTSSANVHQAPVARAISDDGRKQCHRRIKSRRGRTSHPYRNKRRGRNSLMYIVYCTSFRIQKLEEERRDSVFITRVYTE